MSNVIKHPTPRAHYLGDGCDSAHGRLVDDDGISSDYYPEGLAVLDPYTDPIPSAHGLTCMYHLTDCKAPAAHKVEEVTTDGRHPLTTYLCCGHFGELMGPLAVRSCIRASSEAHA